MEWFKIILAEPMYNLLVWLYQTLPLKDVGLAIVLLTIVIKAILWPLTGKSLKGQKALQSIQPKMDEIKTKYKDDKEKMAKEMMTLYKTEKVNPASSCLPLLIQLPILIALYRVLLVGVNNEHTYRLYNFIQDPGIINTAFLGMIDLSKPAIVLAVLAGVAQYFQARMMTGRRPPQALREKSGAKDEDMMAMMNKSMLYFMPIMTVLIGSSLPGGLALYWLVVTLLSILQQHLVFRRASVS
jgi:YidC/Oxa1 family membrane protein insertase